jgi:uncharacterized protein (TIGR00251 family)
MSAVIPGSSDTQDTFLREHPDGCSLAVRVQPGAKRAGITGVHGQNSRLHLNVALQAPPVEGRANEALISYLAKLLAMPRSKIKIIHGEHDRFKLLVLEGMKVAEAQATIQSKLPALR